MPFPSFPLGSRQHISARLRSLRRSAAGFIGGVVLAAAGAIPGRAELPPDVFSTEESIAPAYTIPHPLGGSSIYEGAWTLAGDHLVEMDPYNLATSSAEVSLTVRKAADHAPLYRLRPNIEITGATDGEVFSDGKDLAFRTRPQPDATARVEVRDLATGALRFSLGQTDPRGNDDFGRAVWFTANRILVAAPGRDRYHRDAGALYVFDRATGRHVGNVGPGVKGALFGTAPDSAARGGPQPLDTPYVQVSGKRALIVHGRRAFVFSGDRLHPLVIPANGLNRVELHQAILTEDRVILATAESRLGRVRPGRVIGYELATRRRLYQLGAAALRGSYDFPSRILVENGRLHVLDAVAGAGGTERRGALHVFNVANGKRVRGLDFPYSENAAPDARSFTYADGRLWLRRHEPAEGQTPRTLWHAYDPATLETLLFLAPPGEDRFRGRAPQTLPGGRLAVAASRVTRTFPWPILFTPVGARVSIASSAASRSFAAGSSWQLHDPFTTTGAGVLLYDLAAATWTHRLVLEGDFVNYHNSSWDPQPYDNLRITPGPVPASVLVRGDGNRFAHVSRYDPALSDIEPSTALEGRLSASLQSGFAYGLFRRASPRDAFAFESDLGVSLSASLEKVVPYEYAFAAGAYRLDGQQISHRLSAPETALPMVLHGNNLTGIAAFGDSLVVGSGTGVFAGDSQRVELIDLSTGELRASIADAGGPLALNDDYLVLKVSGVIKLYDARTGASLPLPVPYPVIGDRVALSGDRLVTTSAHSHYLSGDYTHVARVNIYSLPGGQLLHSLPFATKTSSLSWDTPPLDLAVTDDAIIVRTVPDVGSYADAGRVRVIDLHTFETRYELASPAPSTGDWFGGWLAAAGQWLAVGSGGASEVFVFDLPTGELRHTLVLSDRPDDITDYAMIAPRLVIDAEHDRLGWFVNDDPFHTEGFTLSDSTAVYLFDLATGLEEAKITPAPSASSSSRAEFTGVALVGGRLLATTKFGAVLSVELADALAAPLATTSEILAAEPAIRLEFPSRRGVSYQPEASADDGATWTALGAKHYGDGQPATLRRSLAGLPAPESLRFRLRTAWESAPLGWGLVW